MFLPVIAQHAAEISLRDFLLTLSAILVSAKLMGELAEWLGQPAVLGELLAGVILGKSLLGIVDPAVAPIHLLAELGVILLLFQIGMETNLAKLLKVGGAAFVVATVGVAVPFALGFLVARMLGAAVLPAIVIGASLTATSVGITARVLSDLRRLQTAEGQIILGAAVIDDVMGLIILGVVGKLVIGESPTIGSVTQATLIAFGFLVFVVLIGRVIALRIFEFLARITKPEALAGTALAFAFVLAVFAESVGSALIIGAFAAGLVLQPSPHRASIEHSIVRIGHFFVPIFFVTVAASVDLRVFTDRQVLLLGLLLLLVAVIGKFVAGYGAWWFRGKKALVGVGMIPRGEVGLIFAQMGLTAAVLNTEQFSSVMVMVIGTTLIAPPLLKRMISKAEAEELVHEHEGTGALTSEV
jgi:Kef-type K+ transport system membrane component KefB